MEKNDEMKALPMMYQDVPSFGSSSSASFAYFNPNETLFITLSRELAGSFLETTDRFLRDTLFFCWKCKHNVQQPENTDYPKHGYSKKEMVKFGDKSKNRILLYSAHSKSNSSLRSSSLF